MAARVRIVIADAARDELDGAGQVIARALRDAGMEVVYTGRQQTPEQIVQTVIQEDAHAVGLADAATPLVTRTAELLAGNDASDVLLFATSLSSDDQSDVPGDATIFAPDTAVDVVVAWVRAHVLAGAEA
jgi:methylmalonyl-CoA mutase C-terminal domain/subunit